MMTKLKPTGLKVLKCFHLILIMMWTVGVLAMTLLLRNLPTDAAATVLTVNYALLIDSWLVIPGALLTVLTGIVYGVFTGWGFFKFHWITAKWIVAIAVILIGTFYFHPHCLQILEAAGRLGENYVCDKAAMSAVDIVAQASIYQGLALVVLVILSVFKPGKRKKQPLQKQ